MARDVSRGCVYTFCCCDAGVIFINAMSILVEN